MELELSAANIKVNDLHRRLQAESTAHEATAESGRLLQAAQNGLSQQLVEMQQQAQQVIEAHAAEKPVS